MYQRHTPPPNDVTTPIDRNKYSCQHNTVQSGDPKNKTVSLIHNWDYTILQFHLYTAGTTLYYSFT